MAADEPAASPHPLDSLSVPEIDRAVELVRADGLAPEGTWFSDVELIEPTRRDLERFADGEALDRLVRVVLVTGPTTDVTETVVSLTADQVVSSTVVVGVCSTILDEESFYAAELLKADPQWQTAMAKRGITDFDTIVIDPWPAGRYGLAIEEGCRLARCTSYVKEAATDNMYARPVDGVVGFVDTGRRRVVRVDDHGVVPVPPVGGGYLPGEVGPVRSGLRPLVITQPEGSSFTIEGGLLQWQCWSMRVSVNAHEGLVLHTVGYDDGGQVRPILFRASIDEMIVPYGAPGPMHSWKNAFDASEWGLGKAANSLVLGCDCLGEIRYLDAAFATERGRPYQVRNAVCIHEEDTGVIWRHTDIGAGTNEVRRGRRLVVSSFATAGNYDYGFFWYFFLDGTIECEVKLTGIVSTEAIGGDPPPTHATRVSEHLAAPNHQHIFNARLHFDVDGPCNSVFEVDAVTDEAGVGNELGGAFSARSTPLERELVAQRFTHPAAGRVWKVINPGVLNAWGDPVAYKLLPGPTPTLMALPDSSVARRAAFATRNLWVTPYAPDERRAAGEYPNQHIGGDGLPRWTAANRSLIETDLVLWYSFGVTHIPRPEDFPVMPVERTGFSLLPSGFFDRNPALDLPAPEECH
jgi:primary-amine oxidase